MVSKLAARHPGAGIPTSIASLTRWFEFRDFIHFIEVYAQVSSLVRTAEDIADIVVDAAQQLSRQNIRYAEMTVTPYTQVSAGVPYTDVVEGLDQGRRAASGMGVDLAWVYDISGEMGQEAASATLDMVLNNPPDGLVGFGLGGPEKGVERSSFQWAFDKARAAGLKSVPHAGEADGPSSIWAALEALGADRIGHGVRAVEDSDLVARLVQEQIPLEVCPSSNVCTGVFPALSDHSLPILLDAGAFVTINSDDPPMFSTTLNEEYERIAEAFDLGIDAIAMLIRNGIDAAFISNSTKASLARELDACVQEHKSPGYP